MTVVNIHEAKTHFSRLVERAEGGEEITIARAGKPVARLSALPQEPSGSRNLFGSMRGQISVPEDIHDGDAEIIAMFDASEIEPPPRGSAS